MKPSTLVVLGVAALGVIVYAISRRPATVQVYEAPKGTLEQIGALAEGVGAGIGSIAGPIMPWLAGGQSDGRSSSGS